MSERQDKKETVSKKRGRPRLLAPPAEAVFKNAFPEIRTTRGRQNRVYMSSALKALKGVPGYLERYRWLVGDDGNTFRVTLLTELGRLRHPGTIVAAADKLCEMQPRREVGVAYLRRVRGIKAEPRADRLLEVLATALDAYCRAHHDCTPAMMLDAINELYGIVAEWQHDDRKEQRRSEAAPS